MMLTGLKHGSKDFKIGTQHDKKNAYLPQVRLGKITKISAYTTNVTDFLTSTVERLKLKAWVDCPPRVLICQKCKRSAFSWTADLTSTDKYINRGEKRQGRYSRLLAQ